MTARISDVFRKPGPEELANRQRLVDAIRNNETLTVTARKD